MIACILVNVMSYTIAVAGARGGLGRELVAQAVDRGYSVIGIVRDENASQPIFRPCRVGWLDEFVPNTQPVRGDIVLQSAPSTMTYDALILSMSGKPFSKDDSVKTTRALLDSLPLQCRDVVLVSAHGVGDSIDDANVGIRIMRSAYLRQTYAAKQVQETLVNALDPTVRTRILRPKVLSYGPIPWNTIATPREVLAHDILNQLVDQGCSVTTS